MEIWLDGVDADLIKKGNQLGAIHGVTTNPSIIAKSNASLEETLSRIEKNHQGPIAVQVLAKKAEDIIEQAETLRDYSESIIVKIPTTEQGLKAMQSLSHLQLPIMATGIVTTFQALLACHTGVSYLAPYYSHIEETGVASENALAAMLHTVEYYGFETKVLVASLRSLDQMTICLEHGAHGVTLKPSLFNELIGDHPLTLKHIEKFSEDAKEGSPSKLISI